MRAVKTNQELSAKVDFVLVGLKRSVVAKSLTGRGHHTALKLANSTLHVPNSIARSIHCVILEETVKLCAKCRPEVAVRRGVHSAGQEGRKQTHE